MNILLTAVLSGLAGAMAAHAAYLRSNLFILGDTIRRSMHPLWDPLGFAGLGLLFGIVTGVLVGAWWFPSSLGKSLPVGIGITLLVVAATGGAVTYSRYQALPREPMLEGGPVELEFELWLPLGRDAATGLPEHGLLSTGGPKPRPVQLLPQQVGTREGRLVLPGRAQIDHVLPDRLLSIGDRDWGWVNFTLPHAAVPTSADAAWTDWLRAINAGADEPAAKVFFVRSRVLFAAGR